MATTRATFGSVLSVIGTSAGAVISLLDNVNSGLDMLSTTIEVAKHNQTFRAKGDMASAEARILAEFSTAEVLANLEILQFCGKSQQHLELYQQAQAKYQAVFAAK